MVTGVEIGRFYDPETDCWFMIYKFTAKEIDKYIQESDEICS